MGKIEARHETVGAEDIDRLEAFLRASGRPDTVCCGLSGETMGQSFKPAIRHSSDDVIGRAEEVAVEASPAVRV